MLLNKFQDKTILKRNAAKQKKQFKKETIFSATWKYIGKYC